MNETAPLSEEILLMIFRNIQSLPQLATCRLVRKAWRDPAAKIMFSREIKVESESKAIQLHRHLLLDPSKAKLITKMRFTFDADEIPLMVEELLDVAITPSIKNIDGSVKSVRFFNKLFSILNDTTQSYDKLESLPYYTGNNISIGVKTLAKTVKFATSVRATLASKPTNLSKYLKLKNLTLTGNVNALQTLEETLNSCRRISYLKLQDFTIHASVEGMSVKDVKAWCQPNVERNYKCQQMDINTVCHPQLLEYLSFKYPRGELYINGALKAHNRARAFPKGDLKRILDVAADGRTQRITLIMPANTKMKEVALFFKNQTATYKFYLKTIKEREELMMDVMNYTASMYDDID
ncbi:hypothetical protein MBANPS3_004526, partial [Mucor bainieri]